MAKTFGASIRELRKRLGLSQRDLASRVDIDFTYLSKIENDKTEPPSERVIERLATELDTSADDLIVLAGKIPSDLARILAAQPEQIRHLRSLAERRSGPPKRNSSRRPKSGDK